MTPSPVLSAPLLSARGGSAELGQEFMEGGLSLPDSAVRAHLGELESGKLTPLEKIRPVHWVGSHELPGALETRAVEGSSA